MVADSEKPPVHAGKRRKPGIQDSCEDSVIGSDIFEPNSMLASGKVKSPDSCTRQSLHKPQGSTAQRAVSLSAGDETLTVAESIASRKPNRDSLLRLGASGPKAEGLLLSTL